MSETATQAPVLATFKTDTGPFDAGGALLLVAGLIAAGVAVFGPQDSTVRGVSWTACVLFGVLGFSLLLRSLSRRSVTYTISTRRIDVEKGFLGKRYESLELWRVRDTVLEQSLLDRMRGVGTLTIYSGDATTPVLRIGPLKDAKSLFARLRDAAAEARRSAGVVGVS